MLRRFRWQILALVISVVIFGLVVSLRFLTPPVQDTSQTPSHTPTDSATLTPAPTFTAAPTFTPQPSDEVERETDTVITFTEGVASRVERLNPLLISSQAERDITALIFEGLVRINEFGEAVPELAAEWSFSRDGYEMVVLLRQDVLWQDGTPFTVDDVLFTYGLLASPAYPVPEIRAFWQTVELQRLGDFAVRFRLAQPLASFPTRLTTGILPQHALVGTTADLLVNHPFNLTPVGTGPYQLEGLRSANGQQINGVDLRLAPTFRQRPEGSMGYVFERLRFRIFGDYETAINAFVAGEIDGLAGRSFEDRDQLLQLGGATVLTQLEPTVGMLIFNWDEGEETRFFSDSRIRQALQLSLNRRNPVETVLFNRAVAADSPLRPDSWAYNSAFSYPEPDPARAIELFDSANIVLPEDVDFGDVRYQFSILVIDTPLMVGLAQNIANQWSQFDLAVSVEAVAPDTFQTRLDTGDFDSAIVEYQLGADPDVFAYWHPDQYPDGLNYGGVTDTRISESLERGRQTVANLSRVRIYRDFQVQFANQAIALPLYNPLFTYVVRQDVTGIQLGFISSPEDRFRTLQDWALSSE